MPSLRLCSHIKTNGAKCASPALRHHTLCYFHYQWQRRDQRRIRLGGPAGMGKNSGIELPLLDGPEAILLSIMEIQRGLLDQRIPIKMGTALLYSLQLALQAKIPRVGLCPSEAVRECPELDDDLEMERAQAMRPAKEKCAACPKREDCLSPRNCRKLPKVPGYHRVDNRLVRDLPPAAQETDSSSRAVPDTTTDSSFRAKVVTCSSRAAVSALATAVEGPASLPTEATSPQTSPTPETATNPLRESSPGRDEPGVPDRKFPPSRANARRQIDTSKIDANPHADNILGSKPNALLDLAEKFPQLAETKRAENQGVQGVGVIAPRLERRG